MDIRSTSLRQHWQLPSVKAVLLLSLVMILTTVVGATALLLDLRQKELAHAKGEVLSLTRILAEQTTHTFGSVAQMMRGTRDRLSDDTGRRLNLDSVPIQLLLRARTAGLPQVESLFLVDRQGVVVNASVRDPVSSISVEKLGQLKHMVAGAGEMIIGTPEKSQGYERWTFYVGLPVLDDSETIRGVLVAAINTNYFESLYKSIGLDSVSRIQLLDHNGVLLSGQPRETASFGQPVGDAGALDKLRTLPDGMATETHEGLNQDRRLVAYRKVDEFPLIISAAANEDEALAPWRRIMHTIVSGVIVVIFFLLLVTYLLIKNLMRRTALESALKETGDQLRHTVQVAKDAIVTADSRKRIVLFNHAAEQLFGHNTALAIGSGIEALFSQALRPSERTQLALFLKEAWQTPATLDILSIVTSTDGMRKCPVELNLSTTLFRGEILLTVIVRDLTERQRSERELLETNRQLKQLSASLQTVREEQRSRISRELHDELGQMLTGIRMEVSWLGGRLSSDESALIDKVSSIKNQIDQTIASVRRISSELRPLVLDDLGFSAAASWYVDQFSARTEIPVNLQLPNTDPPRGGALTTALFRILQESLTNVARHADAAKVIVRLNIRNGIWALTIKDDGLGFVHDPGTLNSIGLIGMRERVQMLGGHFSVRTEPGAGTEIRVLIPEATTQEEQ